MADKVAGYAVAEAMACGTPAITTNSSALPELIDNNKDGILCQVDDVQGFIDAIVSLKEDRNRLIAMGEAAREKIVSRFSLDLMTSRYISLYRELLDSR